MRPYFLQETEKKSFDILGILVFIISLITGAFLFKKLIKKNTKKYITLY